MSQEARGYASGLTLQVTSGQEVEIIAERKPQRKRSSSKPRSKAAASKVANRVKPAPRKAKGRKVDQSDIQKAKLQSGNSSADDHPNLLKTKIKVFWASSKGRFGDPNRRASAIMLRSLQVSFLLFKVRFNLNISQLFDFVYFFPYPSRWGSVSD